MADEFDLKPTSRGEEFLDVILRSLGGDTPDIPQPAWRYEEYLAAIANAIQNGGGSSGGGVLMVHVDGNNTFDKTWQEVHDAFSGGVTVIAVNSFGNMQSLIVGDGTIKNNYFVTVASQENWLGGMYTTSSTDGYPYKV